MKTSRMHFYNQSGAYAFAMILCSIFFMILGTIEIFQSSQLNNVFFILGQVALVLFFLRMFLSKYCATYNKVGMSVRMRYFSFGKSLVFKDVTSFRMEDNILIIERSSKDKISLNLKDIVIEDQIRLWDILDKYSTFSKSIHSIS